MAGVTSLTALHKQLSSLVGGPTVYVQDDRSFANEIMTKALFDAAQGLPECRRVIVGRYTHEQIDLADAHQLAKKIVREKTFFSQLFGAPWYATVNARSGQIRAAQSIKSNSTQTKPVKLVGTQSQQLRQVPNAGRKSSSQNLHTHDLRAHPRISIHHLRCRPD